MSVTAARAADVIDETGIVKDEAVVYDYYDLTGEVVSFCKGTSDRYIGAFEEAANSAVRLRITPGKNVDADHYYWSFAIGQTDDVNGWVAGGGYVLAADWDIAIWYNDGSATQTGDTIRVSTEADNKALKIELVRP